MFRSTLHFLFLLLAVSPIYSADPSPAPAKPSPTPVPSTIATPPPDPANLHLYLLVGQSNMAGRGKVGPVDEQSDPKILILDANNDWVTQGEPIHFDKPGRVGVGPGLAFARLMAEKNPDVTIGLIPCAVGGTPISRWLPGQDLFNQAVARAKIAQKSGTLKGILWHQGETDSDKAERASAYAANLAKVATGFREALSAPNVPFVAGQIGEFLYTHPKLIFSKTINAQIEVFPSLVPHAAFVSSTGLAHKGDNLHFSTEAQHELAKRYFDAFQALSKKP